MPELKRPERSILGKRRMAREMAVQMLYQVELGESTPREARAAFDVGEYLRLREEDEASEETSPEGPPRTRGDADAAFEQACAMVAGVRADLDEVDGRIRTQAEHWRLERMPAVDRNILRLAVWEMLFDHEVPKLVAVDEAVELAKRFGSEQSARFVNGLLDGLMKALEVEAGSEP